MFKKLLLFMVLLMVLLTNNLLSQNYVGSATCKLCHSTIYDNYMKTGHPHKLIKIEGAAPTFPAGTSPGVPNPPADKSWNDITYMIGGFGWKARFLDKDGYILTGAENRQYNLENSMLGTPANWVGYDAAKAPRKPYTCGSCHTTGWVAGDSTGPHQDNLPGIYGTWAEPGVRCEACHGPASAHVANPSGVKPSKVEKCGDCHARGDVMKIDAKNGLIDHHEQYEDLLASPHKSLPCGTCHEPHLSTKYNYGGYKGKDQTCKVCHSTVAIKIAAKANWECSTCHMPYAAKSAMSITINHAGGSVPKGDLRTHIFDIKSDADWKMFTDDGKYVRIDDEGKAHISVEYACLTCHTSKDVAWASSQADRIHGTGTAVELIDNNGSVPDHFALYQNHPNPFNPTTTISFDLNESRVVVLKLFNMRGQELMTLMNERLAAGHHQVTFSADDLPSGMYIYRLMAGDFVASKKMLLLR